VFHCRACNGWCTLLYTRHFTVSVAEDVVSIRDEGSTNGTKLNNIKLSKDQYAHLFVLLY
jgi:hypothetical protein